MIRTRGLSYTYATGGAAPLRFPDVDLRQGGTLLLRGRSGTGKSTWLALMAGLRGASGGDLFVAGTQLVTLVERKSRYTLAAALPRRTSTLVGQAMIDLLRPHKRRCKTITLDNGKEFADHAFIGKCLGAKVYFAHPYCSWQRGLNENHNGLLRQYFPKAMSLAGVTQAQVDEAVYALNHRPRKCLGWRTPHEVFYGLEITPLRLETCALRT